MIGTLVSNILIGKTDSGPLFLLEKLFYLSLSYQKKDGCTWPRPSFFWYYTDFLEFEFFVLTVAFLLTNIVKVVVIPKEGWRAHPSFGMTTTKTFKSLKSVFS